MKVELFYTEGCSRCASSRLELQLALERISPGSTWQEIDVLRNIDYAVELGVLSLPAIAIDGMLAFSSLPTANQFERELEKRERGGHVGH